MSIADGSSDPTSTTEPRNGRTQLVIMLLIASVSLFGSYFLFFGVRDAGTWGTTNYGAFVTPPTTVETIEVAAPVDGLLKNRDSWQLLTLAHEPCEAACQSTLHTLRQMQVLLNKDSDRVRRVFVGSQALAEDVVKDYPKLATGQLVRTPLEDGVYIIDPIGNLVFHYDFELDASAMLKDLKRLLKVSQIG
ncbi:MAG: hypothetical protein AAF648_01925 [Pseudomonadota bacterium]